MLDSNTFSDSGRLTPPGQADKAEPSGAYLSYEPLSVLLRMRHAGNPKGHDLAAIRSSIERFGYITPVIVVGKKIGEGHGRTEVLEPMRIAGDSAPDGIRIGERGEWLVPVVHAGNLSPEELEAFLVAANRTTELGGWDDTVLAELLSRIATSQAGLAGTGFSLAGVDDLIASLGRARTVRPDPDDIPAKQLARAVRAQPGDLYRPGQHRLLVGDARDPESIFRLASDDIATCLLTDPPYGVRYIGKTAARMTIQNDGAEGLGSLLLDCFQAANSALAAVAALFVFHPAGPLARVVADRFQAVGWQSRQSLVWLKDTLVLGHGDFHYRHKPILYGRKPGQGRWGRGAKGWYGGNDQSSVFEVPRPKASRDHSTAKPVRLLETLIRCATRSGDAVLDPFAGSGSCLIACELLGRRFLGLEIDPIYAQVILDRWERYTGRAATKESP